MTMTARKASPTEATLFASTHQSEAERFRQRLVRLIANGGFETMTITPVMAEVMLERNEANRPVNQTAVRRFADAMRQGQWMVTGEPIVFAKEGILNDGQHRLQACVLSGCPFRSDVRFGIERDAFRVTNVGAKRTLSDVLGIDGVRNSRTMAATLNWVYRYGKGLPGHAAATLSNADGVEFLAVHPTLPASVEVGQRLYRETGLLSPSLAAFLHYICAAKDPTLAATFFDTLTTGLGLSRKSDALYLLRQRLIDNKGRNARLPDVYLAAITLKAWNALRTGRTVRSLKWQTDAACGAEPFPEAV